MNDLKITSIKIFTNNLMIIIKNLCMDDSVKIMKITFKALREFFALNAATSVSELTFRIIFCVCCGPHP